MWWTDGHSNSDLLVSESRAGWFMRDSFKCVSGRCILIYVIYPYMAELKIKKESSINLYICFIDIEFLKKLFN